ncbi:MAG: class I SAM-dependent methyltransferase [Myxococcales bacterium]|nr:class I SAM-dependent methyltransferase [Myxococcales bacterium]MCB9717637.1 class I SAM-dependent methyltransferase [Myxococcales bacterium]
MSGDTPRQAELRLHAEQSWESPFEGPRLEPRLLDLLERLLPPHGLVVDLGCGTGHLLVEIHDHLGAGRARYLGIDASAAMVEAAIATHREAAPTIEWEVDDAHGLALADATVDVLVSRWSEFSAAEVARVLRPGGYFVEWGLGPRDSEDVALAFGERFACEYAPHEAASWYAARDEALLAHGLVTRSLELVQGDDYLDRQQLEETIEMVPLVEPFDRERDAAILDAMRHGPRPGSTEPRFRVHREHFLRVAQRREGGEP